MSGGRIRRFTAPSEAREFDAADGCQIPGARPLSVCQMISFSRVKYLCERADSGVSELWLVLLQQANNRPVRPAGHAPLRHTTTDRGRWPRRASRSCGSPLEIAFAIADRRSAHRTPQHLATQPIIWTTS